MMTLALALRSSGTDVTLVCVSEELARVWEAEVGAPASVVHLSSRFAAQRSYVNFKVWSFVARRSDIAAIVVFSYVLAAGVVYYRIRRLAARRALLILDLHDNLAGPRGRSILRFAARAFDAVVSVSRHTDSQLEGVKARRSVIYRPVAAPPEVRPAQPSSTCRVGVIGRLDPQKKIDLAIEAFAGLSADYHLVLRGESADGGDVAFSNGLLERAAKSLGSRFHFEGPVAWSLVMQGLDILVVCNDDEPMGRTVAEAQLAGLVVVVPDSGGSTELVEDGVTGFVYLAGDAESLAKVIVRASDSAPNDAITRRARVVAGERHDIASYATKYMTAIGMAAESY